MPSTSMSTPADPDKKTALMVTWLKRNPLAREVMTWAAVAALAFGLIHNKAAAAAFTVAWVLISGLRFAARGRSRNQQ